MASSIKDLDTVDWRQVVGPEQAYLQPGYLQILEEGAPVTQYFRYLIYYRRKRPIGVLYFQVIDFVAEVFGDLLAARIQDLQSKRARLFERYIQHKPSETIMRLVTLGNNFISGEYGFSFIKEVSREESFLLMEQVSDIMRREERLRGKISAILVKDFHTPHEQSRCVFGGERFTECSVEPNMMIHIPQEVRSLEDYIARFSKKYRARSRNIFKAAEGLTLRELGVEDLQREQERIYELYMQVYQNARFKIVQLSPDYFLKLKHEMGEGFQTFGLYKEDTLVAFASAVVFPDHLDAHYIGFDYAINKDYELYQNLLYRFIELCIRLKKPQLNLGRTASEIKSTVGAVAQELTCYIRPQNTVSRVILRPFMSFLQPAPWTPRNPFAQT